VTPLNQTIEAIVTRSVTKKRKAFDEADKLTKQEGYFRDQPSNIDNERNG